MDGLKMKNKACITVECKISPHLYHVLLTLFFWNRLDIKGSARYFLVRIAFYSILFLSSILCIPIFLFSPRNLKNSTFYAKHIGKHTTLLYGIKWEIRGKSRLGEKGGAVIVANHQHELDIVGMFTVWPFIDRCAAIAKQELLWSPFGLAAWLAGVVFINRSKPQSARGRINKTLKILGDNKKIFMFPEGTRNCKINETKKLLPFKKGAFHVAIQAQVPIIPVVFSPYYFVNDKEKILYPGGKVVISVLPPVPTSGLQMEDMGNFIESIRDQMQREYINLDDEITCSDEMTYCIRFFEMVWENIYLFIGSSMILLGVQVYRSSTVRYYFKFIYFVIHSAVMATIFIPFMLFKPRSWTNAILPAAGLRLIKRLFGLELRIRGMENIVNNTGAIVLINHQSILDLLVLAELWKIMDRCTVISKKEVMYFGPFGLASWLWGTIFIDRLNPDQAKGTINRTGETVRQRKSKLLMFPEGTRHGGHELLSFKKGAFHVAVASHVPIQPVVVSKYYFINHEKKIFDKGISIIDILPAIETDEYIRSTVDGLIDKTYQVMSDGYKQVNREVYATIKDKCPEKYDWNEGAGAEDDSVNPS